MIEEFVFFYWNGVLFQVNRIDTAIVKIPRHQIEQLKDSQVLTIALEQKEVQKSLKGQAVTNSVYQLYVGYRAEMNIYAIASSAEKVAVESSQ